MTLLLGCAKSKGDAEPPGAAGTGNGAGGDGSCPENGPTVSVNIRGHAPGELPQDQLGALLGWVGDIAQPCREAPAKVPRFTLVIELPEDDSEEPPKLELANAESLPELAACIDEHFAEAPPPPKPWSMNVVIVSPWGCDRLGTDFQSEPAPVPATDPDEQPAPDAASEPATSPPP
jgi:hypothetical protein